MDAPALDIRSFSKTYAGGTTAVSELSLTVPVGTFFGLVGPNGAGKTSTIQCVTGIGKIQTGSISVFGYDVVSQYRRARQCIGLSPQEFNVDIFATPHQILDWIGGFYGMPAQRREQRTKELLERFQLTRHADKKFKALSGGLKRRVMLARALVHDPPMLILDEPTAGVDVELRHQLWQFLRELNGEGKTILLTSHYIEEIELLCERAAIMSGGQIVADDTIDSLKDGATTLEERYLTLTSAETD
jgi:ABC-2 type transport system ATP-binding protein